MKTAILFIRTLIGLLLVFVSVSYFFNLMPELVSDGDFKAIQLGLIASVYLMPMVKIIELLCGLSYLSGQYITLTNIIILPVSTNILFYSFFLNQNIIPLALFVFLGNLFFIYTYRKNYKSIFKRK